MDEMNEMNENYYTNMLENLKSKTFEIDIFTEKNRIYADVLRFADLGLLCINMTRQNDTTSLLELFINALAKDTNLLRHQCEKENTGETSDTRNMYVTPVKKNSKWYVDVVHFYVLVHQIMAIEQNTTSHNEAFLRACENVIMNTRQQSMALLMREVQSNDL